MDLLWNLCPLKSSRPTGCENLIPGRFQSIQWTAANMALLLAGGLGGYVAEQRLQFFAFATSSQARCSEAWVMASTVDR